MKRLYLNRCKDCGQTFETPYVGGKYCPACKRKRISEGQKARQARERQERDEGAAANGRQVKTGNSQKEKEAENVRNVENDAQKQWESLGEAENAANEARPDPAAAPELPRHPREAREVLVDLYGTVRRIAKAAGLDPSRTIEALWEIDSILGAVGRA